MFRGAGFLLLLCLKQIFLGATIFGGHTGNFGGHCLQMPPRGYGPVQHAGYVDMLRGRRLIYQ